MLTNANGKLLATFCGEEFRVTQAANAVGRIENHGSCDDRTKKRSAADFVGSGHELCSTCPRKLFKFQRALQALQQSEFRSRRRERFRFRRSASHRLPASSPMTRPDTSVENLDRAFLPTREPWERHGGWTRVSDPHEA